jgi:hypothetical protein
VADGEGPFKQLKEEQFEAVSAQLAPKLQAGHEVSYLGDDVIRGHDPSAGKHQPGDRVARDDMVGVVSVNKRVANRAG